MKSNFLEWFCCQIFNSKSLAYQYELVYNQYKHNYMGIASSIRNCFQEESSIISKPLQIRSQIINEDFQYFNLQNWYRFQDELLFDPNKFIFLYSGYANDQKALLQLWKIVNLRRLKAGERWIIGDCIMSNRWKYAIRRGVPIYLYKNVIEVLFQNRIQRDYSKKYKGLFEKKKKQKTKIKPNSFKHQSQESFKQPFLTSKGQQALKRITFLISAASGQLEFNPYILTLISMLLLFVEESTAYLITSFLIQSSFNTKEQNREYLKYHLTLNEYQFEKLAEKFYKTVKKISPTVRTINEHLNTEGIEKIKLFEQIVGNFFFGFLPFGIILKIFLQFLNEGIQILFRVFYAILKVTGPSIRDSNNNSQILRVIKSKLLAFLVDEKNIRLFFRYAFDLKLSTNFQDRMIEISSKRSKEDSEVGVYYLPTIFGGSEILSYQCVQCIWSFLPEALKHYDLRKIYPSQQTQQSLSLKIMLKALAPNNFTMVVIQCLQGEVFGIFLAEKINLEMAQKKGSKIYQSTPLLFKNDPEDKNLNSSKSSLARIKNQPYSGSSESFLFTIAPHRKKFVSTGENIFYCSCNGNYFLIGGPADRPALQLDSFLSIGLSFSCPTYGNTPLHGGPPGEFRIEKIECFSIQ